MQVTNPRRFITFIIVVVLVVALAFFMLFKLFLGADQLMRSGELVIEEGSTAGVIWQQLVDQDFTASTTPWKYQAWRMKAGNKIKSGTYQLTVGESIPDVIKRLVSGDIILNEASITYPEGFTIEQFAARTAKNLEFDEAAFTSAAIPAAHVEQFPFLSDIPSSRNLEGYLFPDTYRFAKDTTAEEVVQRMLATFARKVPPELRQRAQTSGRTLDQAIIMASMIEREVQTDDDMALVSGVLWKRFDDGVGLGVDATVRYALNKWDEPLTVQDLASNSPYNTRKFRGLPPGPISNPGLRAIQAAINPEPSDAYYYLSAPSGETIFSRTLEEHNSNKNRYLR